MPCFHPWKPNAALGLPPTLLLPCRQCIGCKLRRSGEWASRCWHETKLHDYNSWITLTYDDEHLPSRYNTGKIHPRTKKPIYAGTLLKEHPQKFIRKTRKALSRIGSSLESNLLTSRTFFDTGTLRPHKRQNTPLIAALKAELRYYYGGEYGEKYGRPHYHICIFGIDFRDKKHESTTAQGYKLYTSDTLNTLWPKGRAIIGDLTWETAAYTARYIMKKITGEKQQKHYEKIDADTGEIINIIPEYNDMSRRPGIAHEWWQKYHDDIYREGESTMRVRGKPMPPPRYYDKLHKRHFPEQHDLLRRARKLDVLDKWENHTPRRLQAEERITEAKIKSLRNHLEEHQ